MVQDLPADPQTLLMAFTTLSLVCLLLWIFARHCGIAIALLLGAQFWSVTLGTQPTALDFGLSFIGIHIYPIDILTVCALCVAIMRVPWWGRTAPAGLQALLAMVVLTVWSTLQGTATFGLQAAGNDARISFWHFLAVTVYLATAPLSASLNRVVTRAWLAAAVAYTLLSVEGWANRGLLAANDYKWVDGVMVNGRPVPCGAALVLSQAAMLLLSPRPPAPSTVDPPTGGSSDLGGATSAWRVSGRRLLAVVFLVAVILLQHRTVWVATLMMALAWWVLRPARDGRRFVSAGAGTLALSVTALLYCVGTFGIIGDRLTASFEETQRTQSTFTWRVLSWQDLLDVPRSYVQWLIGAPFGSGYERFISGTLVTVSPHDYYVHIMLRLGLVGLLALLFVYFQAWRRLARVGPAALGIRIVLLGQLVFFVSYWPSPEQAVLLGFCLWQTRVCAADETPCVSLAASKKSDIDYRSGTLTGVQS